MQGKLSKDGEKQSLAYNNMVDWNIMNRDLKANNQRCQNLARGPKFSPQWNYWNYIWPARQYKTNTSAGWMLLNGWCTANTTNPRRPCWYFGTRQDVYWRILLGWNKTRLRTDSSIHINVGPRLCRGFYILVPLCVWVWHCCGMKQTLSIAKYHNSRVTTFRRQNDYPLALKPFILSARHSFRRSKNSYVIL